MIYFLFESLPSGSHFERSGMLIANNSMQRLRAVAIHLTDCDKVAQINKRILTTGENIWHFKLYVGKLSLKTSKRDDALNTRAGCLNRTKSPLLPCMQLPLQVKPYCTKLHACNIARRRLHIKWQGTTFAQSKEPGKTEGT